MAEVMSADQAVRFEHYSRVNATIVEASFSCECVAYEDVFTYRRWLAQGMQVQKGEKAIKITTYRPITDEDTGEESTYRIVGSHEAEIAAGRLSVTSPLSRALIGKSIGDVVEVATPGGGKSYEIVKVSYP